MISYQSMASKKILSTRLVSERDVLVRRRQRLQE
jgi:hypothetical protein